METRRSDFPGSFLIFSSPFRLFSKNFLAAAVTSASNDNDMLGKHCVTLLFSVEKLSLQAGR